MRSMKSRKFRINIILQRTTYTNRINELRNTDLLYQGADGKALPEPPRERDSQDQDAMSPVTEDDNEHNIMKPSIAQDMIDDRQSRREYRDPSFVSDMSVPPRRQSLVPPIYNVQDKILHASEMAQSLTPPIFQVEDRILQASETARYQQHYGQSQMRANSYMPNGSIEPPVELEAPTYSYYVPPPSSRRPLSPAFRVELSASPPDKYVEPVESIQESSQPNHVRQDTAESTSWLDTIDESGGSSSESVHSRTSSIGLRRKRIRATSGATEAEFDAALDAAVEAAYDDGFEPDDDEDDDDRPVRSHRHMSGEFEVVSNARRNVEMAREKVREAEKEAAILYAKNWEKPPLQESFEKRDSIELQYEDDDAEEEERMMEEIARYYNIDDSEYDAQSKSALPRQSDSSGFSGRTWGSSIGSLPTTAATSSSITEASRLPSMISQLKTQTLPPPAHPPPLGALPPPPSTLMSAAPFQLSHETISKPSNSSIRLTQGVRERRLSGINVKKLKIETHSGTGSNGDSGVLRKPLSTLAFPAVLPRLTMEPPKSALALSESQGISSSRAVNPSIVSSQATNLLESLPLSAPTSVDEVVTSASTTNALTKVTSAESEKGAQSIPNSPSRFTSKGLGLRKNFSSSSLKNKGLAAPAHNTLDFSPASSASTQRKAPVTAVPFMPSSMGSNPVVGRLPADGIYLFESDIHSPITPGSPNPSAANGPLPIEPCPEINHLRPFWFLRCIYQTISHPRGAYITTKLFVPNSIWKVKNVKLKSVEEKVSTCDLLSAALLKLARVDTLDAGAVLKEMLSFEEVTSLAQTNLSKKLGNEVGPTGHSTIFKGSTTIDETASYSETLTSKATNVNSKYSLSSWRKKRSKSSTAPTANPGLAKNTSKNGSLEHLNMDSLPMTDLLDPKLPRRDLGRIQYTGPNSNYMAALARLCDAAQVLGKRPFHCKKIESANTVFDRPNRPSG